MDQKAVLNFIKKYGIITAGCVLYSMGVALFLDPASLASGGVTGIAIILNYVFGWKTGVTIAVINVPLFLLGWKFFGKKFFFSTVYSTLLSSLLIELWNLAMHAYLPVVDNILIESVAGGALFGIGMGLIFRMGSTTGGTDIIVKILRKKFRYLKTSVISMSMDVMIVAASFFVIRDVEILFYTIISIVVFTLLFDWVLYGGNSAKLVYIISSEEKAAVIKQRIIKDLDVGATFMEGEGAYTGNKKQVILCAVKNFLFPKLRDIVREEDDKAFMIVTSAKEIYGEGYKDHNQEEL